MYYTESEICAAWRQAKDPGAQIRVLSELNSVGESEIRRILKRNGCVIKKQKTDHRRRGKRIQWGKYDATIDSMLLEGCQIKEISEKLKISYAAVYQHIQSRRKKERTR